MKQNKKKIEIEVKIRALIVDPNSGSPVLVLKDIESEEMVPIWVGACEANAIASAIENIAAPRPMTHDLLKNLINQLDLIVSRVIITELKDNTYYSVIEIISSITSDKKNQSVFYLDARPSDAIALALRCACPVFVNETILKNSNNFTNKGEDSTQEVTLSEDWPDLLDDSNDLPM